MRILNVHERPIDGAGAALDTPASPAGRLWLRERWPALRLEAGLAVGSSGGHGPVRYTVGAYGPGRLASFARPPVPLGRRVRALRSLGRRPG